MIKVDILHTRYVTGRVFHTSNGRKLVSVQISLQ